MQQCRDAVCLVGVAVTRAGGVQHVTLRFIRAFSLCLSTLWLQVAPLLFSDK